MSRLSLRVAAVMAAAFVLAGCGGGGSTAPVPNGSAARGTQSSSASNGAFSYVADPHFTALTSVAVNTPAAFPYTPSQCVTLIGLACYTPQEIRRAYNVPANLTGAGRTIVIVDAYGSPTIDADLKHFDRYFGLPDPPSFSVVYPGGAPVYNPLQHHNEEGWAGETTLDVEWAHVIAPGANIVLVVAANNGGDVLNNAVRYAVDHHLGDVISQSFGSPEADIAGGGNNLLLQQADLAFQAAKAAKISVVAAAGDWGATNYGDTKQPAGINAFFPASDPLVTGVGGTAIFAADDGTYGTEAVWNDDDACPFGCLYGHLYASGGAPSAVFPVPAFQAAVGNTQRTDADVAYNASTYTTILVIASFSGQSGFYLAGGTSAGAPQWAGIVALAAQKKGGPIGYLNPKLYALPASAFHDITQGDNAYFGPGFSAKAGFDIPTGRGTPDVTAVANGLAAL